VLSSLVICLYGLSGDLFGKREGSEVLRTRLDKRALRASLIEKSYYNVDYSGTMEAPGPDNDRQSSIDKRCTTMH